MIISLWHDAKLMIRCAGMCNFTQTLLTWNLFNRYDQSRTSVNIALNIKKTGKLLELHPSEMLVYSIIFRIFHAVKL